MKGKNPRSSSMRERDDHGDGFNTSSCTFNTYKNFVHRDYLAHSFRWAWAARLIKRGMSVIDVGCGIDQALQKVVRYNTIPKSLVQVDLNKLKDSKIPWLHTFGEFDFTTRYDEFEENQFDIATCFEVVEHMQPSDGLKLLKGIEYVLKPGGIALISTPVFDGKHQAANHPHEWEIPELQKTIEKAGLIVEKRYGTFASYPTIKKVATPADLAVLNRIREFYGDDLCACFLAPLYPDHSRNNVWKCRK
jgi:2-polyprenyl-3-methyl-5-hydroxy-6-metoxy-1,4-benzoquinol methylase